MDVLNLLSGLIGAIIGAVIGGFLSYFGSIKAAEKTISALYKQDAAKRVEENKAKIESIRRSLVAEVNENVGLSEENQVSHAKMKFITDAWNVGKANISFLKGETQSLLQKAYIEIHKYNALVDL